MTTTARQRKVLDFIIGFKAKKGMPPTIAEMQRHFGFSSPKAVADHLASLEKKGFIRRERFKSRAITVTDPSARTAKSRPTAELSPYSSVFSPRSIAVIGASQRDGSVGYSILANILQGHFTGVVYPVNLTADSILGVKCYPSILDVPGEVDLAVVIVRAPGVPDVIRQCARKKVKGLVIVSAGFKETGPEGAALEAEVKRLTAKHGMALIGPNCLGVINTDPAVRLNASFSRSMPRPEPTAFISQSGALCTAILDYARGIGVGFSKFVSIGNKAGASEVDMIDMLGKDPETRVILMYVEDFVDAKRLIEISRVITGEQETKKPILAIKSGRTEAGARAASSHTGSLAGSDEVYDAIFAQSGILRVESVSELFDLAAAFGSQPLPSGRRVAVITNAGGPGIMATDACVRSGLEMAKLDPDTAKVLKSKLPGGASVNNPIDVLGDAKSDRYRLAIEAAYSDPGVDAVLVILTPQSMTDIEETARVVSVYAAQKKKPVVATFMGIVDVSKGVSILRENHVPHYPFPESAARVLGKMHEYSRWVQRPRTAVRQFPSGRAKARAILARVKRAKLAQVPTPDVEAILKLYGFPMLPSAFIRKDTEAAAAARTVGYPAALKVVSAQIIHKVDVKGVKLHIKNDAELAEACARMRADVKLAAPGARIDSLWLQKMSSPGREVIMGMKRDAAFGPLLMFGLGGTYVEIFKDVTFRLAPLRELSARRMIESIRTYPILQGVRGEAPADTDSLTETLTRLSQLSCELDDIQEIDLNPVMVHPAGKGCHVVDARMIL